jgi:hypothetical protein
MMNICDILSKPESFLVARILHKQYVAVTPALGTRHTQRLTKKYQFN